MDRYLLGPIVRVSCRRQCYDIFWFVILLFIYFSRLHLFNNLSCVRFVLQERLWICVTLLIGLAGIWIPQHYERTINGPFAPL